MTELDGSGLAALIVAVGGVLVALLGAMGAAAKWIVGLLLKEAKAAVRAKNTELGVKTRQLTACERENARLRAENAGRKAGGS